MRTIKYIPHFDVFFALSASLKNLSAVMCIRDISENGRTATYTHFTIRTQIWTKGTHSKKRTQRQDDCRAVGDLESGSFVVAFSTLLYIRF